MTKFATRFGMAGETAAVHFLENLGFTIVARNVRVPIGRNRNGALVRGELDIVAFDGETLVFIEVKTRNSAEDGPPETAVDSGKQARLSKTARRYRRLIGPEDVPFRFDVVSIVWREPNPVILLHRNFFKEN